MNLIVETTFLWVSMTPRGSLALPDVYWREARSPSRAGVVAAFTSSAAFVFVLTVPDTVPLLRPHAERRRGRVGKAVAQVHDPDGVAGLLRAQHGAEVVEAVHHGAAEADDDVALAEPRPGRGAAGQDRRDAQAVAVGARPADDDAEEGAARGAALRTALGGAARRARDAGVDGPRPARQPLDRAGRDPADLRH